MVPAGTISFVVNLPDTATPILVTFTSGLNKVAVIFLVAATLTQFALLAVTLIVPELASTLIVMVLVVETPDQ